MIHSDKYKKIYVHRHDFLENSRLISTKSEFKPKF